jgi:DNA-binding MarR family transcriptional regulator
MVDENPVVAALQAWMDIFMRRSMHNFIQYCKENNISLSQMGTLFHLHHKGMCGVSGIGEHLGVTNPAASQILDRMVQQGLIARSEDPQDRRVKQIVLTEKGQKIIEGSIQARQSWWPDLENKLSDAEKEQVLAALDILIQKTSDQNAPVPQEAY